MNVECSITKTPVFRHSAFCIPHSAFCILALWLFAAVAGCGSDISRTGPPEHHPIIKLISELEDVEEDRESFEALFVEGGAPGKAEQMRYRRFMYAPSDPDVSGNSATIEMKISDVEGLKPAQEKTWTAELVGGEWKLKSAPLPPALD